MPLPPSRSTCPKCRAPLPAAAPRGLCPACLMDAAGMETEVGVPADVFMAPLDLETLRGAFPQLEILAPLGAGGMGRVYKVRQLNLDRIAALKVLPVELARDAGWVERFTREARALARLNHPNIVQVYDVGQAAGGEGEGPLCWLLMEYVDGVTLRQVQRTGGLSAREALALVPRLCDALQYAHEKGVLHRDIKPENILLDAAGTVKIADFGLAKLADGRSAPGLTQAGVRLGTAAYMAPEQIESPGDVDHRADIYSLGVVLYELLTGGLPLGRFPAPSEKSGTDPRLDKIVFRTLENERERRYQAAGDVKTALEGVEKNPDIPGERVRPAPRRLRDRGETGPPLPSPGPQQTLFSTSQLILIAILLLILAIGISGGWRAALFLLAMVGGCGILLWLLVTLNGDHRRGMAALSGRTEVARRPQPHGCVAMLAFALAVALALGPPMMATWLLVYRKAALPWAAGTALCGLLSFLLLQPLLRLTGLHRAAGVQRFRRPITVAGAALCLLGMTGGVILEGIWLPGQTTAFLRWGNAMEAGRHNRHTVEKTVEEVFGSDARFVTITQSTPQRVDEFEYWNLSATGTPLAVIEDQLLLCAAKFNHQGGGDNSRRSNRMELYSGRGSYREDGINVHWYALPLWSMAGGAWLLAVRARARRRWLVPLGFLALVAAAGWSLRGWHPIIPGLPSSFKARTSDSPVTADLLVPGISLDSEEPAGGVLRWLEALRRGDDRKARDYEGTGLLENQGPYSLSREMFRTGRLLQMETAPPGAGLKHTDCQLAFPLATSENPEWRIEWVRFETFETVSKTVISRIDLLP